MKSICLSAFVALVSASADNSTLVQPYITVVDDSKNAELFWKKDWEAYRAA